MCIQRRVAYDSKMLKLSEMSNNKGLVKSIVWYSYDFKICKPIESLKLCQEKIY